MAKILVIDDDPDFVNATRMVLEKEGYAVIRAASGKEGFQRAKEELPDLIILDVMMDSILDGLSTSRNMAQDPNMADIPIIMATSIASTSYAEYFPTDEYIHVRAFLSKPVRPADLIRQVNRFLPKE
jgi:CheY-like chemotaxis protein